MVTGNSPPAEIVLAPADQPPFAVELVVLEEDRWRVLSAPVRAVPDREDPKTLMQEMAEDPLPEQGAIILRGNRGLAIVHDLECRPSCRQRDVEQCLVQLFDHCRMAGLNAIAMEPLGTVHGELGREDVIAAIRRLSAGAVSRIWLIES